MSFWTFVFSISVVGMTFAYAMRSKELRHRHGGAPENARLEDLEKKLEQIERRLQSLETIVIERDRHSDFDHALNR